MTEYRARQLHRLSLLAGFCLLILGSKLWLIGHAGSDLPTWDQWDAEAVLTYQPWLRGELSWDHIIHPHNEHRLVTTKLYGLALLAMNGQWSGFLQTAANALLHSLSALTLLLLARRWLEPGWWITFGGLLLLLFGLPFSWENTLVGFQAQFYFLQLFSLLHLWLVLGSKDSISRWLVGQGCGVLALGSMASGFFSSAAVIAVLALQLIRTRRLERLQFATLLLSSSLVATGFWMRNHVPGHDPLMAQGASEFLAGLTELLAWPATFAFPVSVVLAVPLALFVVRLPQRPLSRDDAVLAGFAVWVGLQLAAIAYARGGAGGPTILASRYLDLTACNAALGFVLIAREFSGRGRTIVASLWITAVLVGLGQQSLQHWRDFIVPLTARQGEQLKNVRLYLQTGDADHLLNKPWGHVPYPNGEHLVPILADAEIQQVMPPSVRKPVTLRQPGEQVDALPEALLSSPFRVAFSTAIQPEPGGTRWRSAHQPDTTLPILRFRVAGQLGRDSHSLRLVVKSAAGSAMVVPEQAPGERWKNVTIFRPAGSWWVEAIDNDPHGWFAFTEPVELGYGTWLAEKLIKHHAFVWGSGMAMVLFAGAAAAAQRRSPS